MRSWSRIDISAKNCNRSCVTGFTIIELLVAMSLFLILVAVATGTFIQTLKTQRTITELTAANDNATQAIEQIAREIRTGFGFTDSTENLLKFTNYHNESVSYRLEANDRILCGQKDGKVGCLVRSTGDSSVWSPITAPEVKVERLKFIISGKELTDDFPVRVTIVLTVAGPKDIKVNLQTTISSRVIELEL